MRRTMKERREAAGPAINRVMNLLRRTVVSGSQSATRWSLAGLEGVDGELEAFERGEVFGSVGLAARPADTGADVVVASLGRMQLVLCSRSTAGRPTLEKDETSLYTSLVAVLINKLGQVLLGKNAVDFIIKGTSYRAAEDTMLALFFTAFTELNLDPALAVATKAAATAAASGITTFTAAGATYLSTKVKTE